MQTAKTELQKIPLKKQAEQAFLCHWLYQTEYWIKLLKAGLSVFSAVKQAWEGNRENLSKLYLQAAAFLDEIIAYRAGIYTGEWKSWFAFEKKLDIAGMSEMLKKLAEEF